LNMSQQLGAITLGSIAEKLGLSEKEKIAVNSLILLNPEVMKTQYPTSDALATEAEHFGAEGNKVVASNRFESAAKLALYEGNLNASKGYLEKAIAMGRASPFDVALNSFDKVAMCVVEYYKNRTG
jgi:hypothetical protein